MFVSITKAKSTKGRNWKYNKISEALKNPYIKPSEPYKWISNFNGIKEIHFSKYPAKLEGESIIREMKQTYILKMGKSFRKNGKIKTKQKHLYSFSEWDIVNEFMQQQEFDSKYKSGWCFDYDWLLRKKDEMFPEFEMKKLLKLIKVKIYPIEHRVINEFLKSEEYVWWGETLKLRKKMKIAADKEKRDEKQKEEKKYTEYNSSNSSNSSSGLFSGLSSGLSLSKNEAYLIQKCYRTMAVKLHPDKGGNEDDMVLLNTLIDKIKKM